MCLVHQHPNHHQHLLSLDHSRDILLGQDVISNKLGILISCSSSKPIIWAAEDKPLEIIRMLERKLSIVGKAKERQIRGALAYSGLDPNNNISSPDSTAAVFPHGTSSVRSTLLLKSNLS